MTSVVKNAAAAVTETVAAAGQQVVGDAQEHFKYVVIGGGVGAGALQLLELPTTGYLPSAMSGLCMHAHACKLICCHLCFCTATDPFTMLVPTVCCDAPCRLCSCRVCGAWAESQGAVHHQQRPGISLLANNTTFSMSRASAFAVCARTQDRKGKRMAGCASRAPADTCFSTFFHETEVGCVGVTARVKQWTPVQALPYERPALSKGYLKPSGPAR